jgi:uncharacterized protein (TIRG00374 family)
MMDANKHLPTRGFIKKIKKYLVYFFLLLILIYALWRIDVNIIFSSLNQIHIWSLFALLTLQIISLFIINMEWYLIAKSGGIRISFFDMFYVNCQGIIVEAAPGGKVAGEVSRIFFLQNTETCNAKQSTAVMLSQKIFSFIAFSIMSLFALGYIISDVEFLQPIQVQIALYGILSFLLVMFVAFLLFPGKIAPYIKNSSNKIQKQNKYITKVFNLLLIILNQVIILRKEILLCVILFLLAFMAWALYPIQIYVLTTQLENAPHIVYLGAITIAAYLVSLIPIFPGGLGGFESAMIALLLAAGINAGDALVLTILFRFGTFWFKLLLCFGFISLYKIIKKGRV